MDFSTNKLCHNVMRNDAVLLNHYCRNLAILGRKDEAVQLLEQILRSMEESRVAVKYRYRTYALICASHLSFCRDKKEACKGIAHELICGKSSVLPRLLNAVVYMMSQEGAEKQQIDLMDQRIYYLLDLFVFPVERELYAKYLLSKGLEFIY